MLTKKYNNSAQHAISTNQLEMTLQPTKLVQVLSYHQSHLKTTPFQRTAKYQEMVWPLLAKNQMQETKSLFHSLKSTISETTSPKLVSAQVLSKLNRTAHCHLVMKLLKKERPPLTLLLNASNPASTAPCKKLETKTSMDSSTSTQLNALNWDQLANKLSVMTSTWLKKNSLTSLASTSVFSVTEADKQVINLKETRLRVTQLKETQLSSFQQLTQAPTLHQILAKFQKIKHLSNALMMSLAITSTWSSMTTTNGPLLTTFNNSALTPLPHTMFAHKPQEPLQNASARTFTMLWTLKEMPRLYMASLNLIKATETKSSQSVNNLAEKNSTWINNNGMMHSPTASAPFKHEYTG